MSSYAGRQPLLHLRYPSLCSPSSHVAVEELVLPQLPLYHPHTRCLSPCCIKRPSYSSRCQQALRSDLNPCCWSSEPRCLSASAAIPAGFWLWHAQTGTEQGEKKANVTGEGLQQLGMVIGALPHRSHGCTFSLRC